MKAVKAAELGEQIVLTLTVTIEELEEAKNSPKEFVEMLCEACGAGEKVPDTPPEEIRQENDPAPEIPAEEENVPFVLRGYKGMAVPARLDSREEIADYLIDRLIAENKIPVSMEQVEAETDYTLLGVMQKIRYDRMFGGGAEPAEQPDPEELRAQIREDIIREQKEKVILQSIIEQEGIGASQEELQLEAEAMAQSQGAPPEMIRDFFGEDLQGLAGEVKMRKAKDLLIKNAETV